MVKACSKWSLKQSSAWFRREMASQGRCLSFSTYLYPYITSMQASYHIWDLNTLSALPHHGFFLIIEILHSCLVKCQIQTQVSSLCPRLVLWWLLAYSRVNFQIKSKKALNFWGKKVFNYGVRLLIFTGCSNLSVLLSRISFPLDSNFQVGCILCLNYIIMPHKTLC